eukprot:scaffold35467_cov53-Phaeocystis_antarctica.AAC.2
MIHTNVPGFSAADKAHLVALFGSAASGTHNYCEVKAILHRNLPGSSMLQYGQKPNTYMGDRSASKPPTFDPTGLPTASAMHVPHKYAVDDPKNPGLPGSTHGLVDPGTGYSSGGDFNPVTTPQTAVEAVHLQERDIGVLVAAADSAACAMPPPSPPPAKVNVVEATVVFTLTASGSVSDYSDTSSLQKKYATAAGVDESRVTIVVTAASVIITVTITLLAGKTGF